jgi:hypothetical protein
MKVLVVFDPAFSRDPLDAVWISDSPQNRAWYASHEERIDPNSAVFAPASDPLGIIEYVFQHHPTWTEIVVRGTQMTGDLADSLKSEAVVQGQNPYGFKLVRPE